MQTTIYCHVGKESNYQTGLEIGLVGDALDTFIYACNEVKLTVEVNTETGMARIVAVDNRLVSEST